MRYSPILTFSDAAQEAHVWIHELAELLGCEQRVAYDALRTTLHAMRDRLSVEENAKVGDDLPILLRGLYFEAWDPKTSEGYNELDDLPASVLGALPQAVATDKEIFGKILKLLERRRHHKRPTKLDVALKLCAARADGHHLAVINEAT